MCFLFQPLPCGGAYSEPWRYSSGCHSRIDRRSCERTSHARRPPALSRGALRFGRTSPAGARFVSLHLAVARRSRSEGQADASASPVDSADGPGWRPHGRDQGHVDEVEEATGRNGPLRGAAERPMTPEPGQVPGTDAEEGQSLWGLVLADPCAAVLFADCVEGPDAIDLNAPVGPDDSDGCLGAHPPPGRLLAKYLSSTVIGPALSMRGRSRQTFRMHGHSDRRTSSQVRTK